MNEYAPDANESIVCLEQAIARVLAVARAHEPAEAVTPENPEDVPYEWGQITDVLQAVERKEPLWADLMRSAVVLRQAQIGYNISTAELETHLPSPHAAEA